MNKIILGLLAATTLSTAALANDRSDEASFEIGSGNGQTYERTNSDVQDFAVPTSTQAGYTVKFLSDSWNDNNDSK